MEALNAALRTHSYPTSDSCFTRLGKIHPSNRVIRLSDWAYFGFTGYCTLSIGL